MENLYSPKVSAALPVKLWKILSSFLGPLRQQNPPNSYHHSGPHSLPQGHRKKDVGKIALFSFFGAFHVMMLDIHNQGPASTCRVNCEVESKVISYQQGHFRAIVEFWC